MSAERPASAEPRRFSHAGDHLQLMAKVARMYHERGMRQSEIAAELHVSQPRVSRLLKRASELGIVRTTVALPAGVHTDLEDAIEERYGLRQVVVVDVHGTEDDVVTALGSALAAHLEATLIGGDTIGISSWSSTLLAAAESMRPARAPIVDQVVQIMGGIGNPRVQMQATRLIGLFSERTGATPVFMPAPGMLGNRSARAPLMADPTVAEVMEVWPHLTMALVGIGSLEPSTLLRESGNGLSEQDVAGLRRAGAVGDVCLRFFDAEGRLVDSEVNERVVGIDPDQLRRVPRRIGAAGGPRKHSAIRAALLGGWVNVLVTDVEEAERLLDDGSAADGAA